MSSTRVATSNATRRINGTLVLDWLERGLILVLYAWLIARILMAYQTSGNAANLVMLPAEGLVVCLLLIRRTTQHVSRRPGEWGLAMMASSVPLLVRPSVGDGLLPATVAMVLMFSGLLVQLHAKLVLGRSFGCVPAHRGLKLHGPYRHVRHPMYAGYLLTHIGFLLANFTAWNLAVYFLCYALQIPRLFVEERLLNDDPQYAEYAQRVRYRLLPGVY